MQNLTRTLIELHGNTGRSWLANLPSLLERCAERWGLVLGPPFPMLSYHYVCPAGTYNGVEAVLKVGPPGRGLRREIAALEWFAGRGMVRLLAADADWGAMVLARVRPGNLLLEVPDDDAAMTIAAEVMQQLWQPLSAGHTFPSVTEWTNGLSELRAHFGGSTGPLPADLVALAEGLFAELLASAGPPVLLHGDLHHYNILRHDGGETGRASWLAIDPKGMAGEPAYEVGALLRNPLDVSHRPDLPRLLARRVDLLHEHLGFERQRIAGYGLAIAMLSAWWTVEDNGQGWEHDVRVAEALRVGMRG